VDFYLTTPKTAPSRDMTMMPRAHLLELPVELRHQIYSYLFMYDMYDFRPPSPLLYICHQIRNETLPLMLDRPRQFWSIAKFYRWTSKIQTIAKESTAQRLMGMVRHLSFHFDDMSWDFLTDRDYLGSMKEKMNSLFRMSDLCDSLCLNAYIPIGISWEKKYRQMLLAAAARGSIIRPSSGMLSNPNIEDIQV
jgi:hypothetical protein